MGVSAVLPVDLAWVADNSPGSATILAHHWPNVPNLGDITVVDWAGVEPVDMICAGFPCQDVSVAGLRAGLRHGNRSGLWVHVAKAIAALRPRLVFIENVGGLLHARADSHMEPCPWCLGDADKKPILRALGAVLGDLAEIGFDAEWCSVLASDIGAPHKRERESLFSHGRSPNLPTPRTSDSNGGGEARCRRA